MTRYQFLVKLYSCSVHLATYTVVEYYLNEILANTVEINIAKQNIRVVRGSNEVVRQRTGHVLVDLGVSWIKYITIWTKQIACET